MRSSSKSHARSAILAVLCSLTLLAGCTRDHGRVVHTRLADILYEAVMPLDGSTIHFPRAALDDDTRVVLAAPGSTSNTVDAVADIELPYGARLEFAYGAENEGKNPRNVTFSISVVREGEGLNVFERRLSVDAGSSTGWHDTIVDLSRYQGETTLEMSVESDGGPDLFAHMTAPVITTKATNNRPPNVLLVSLDTLRADHLGIYGYERDTSPNMDRIFGEQGVVVDRVYSQATNTIYGHTAMLSGVNPRTGFAEIDTLFPPQSNIVLTMAEVLRRAGYRTAAFTEDALLIADTGFNRGFESYFEEVGSSRKHVEGHIEKIFDAGQSWLERHTHEPFFLFLHTYQVHSPYTPPESHAGMFPSEPDASKARKLLDLYDAEIAYTDEQVDALIRGVDELGLGENTILIVTSDHGEEFGEHGHLYHAGHLTNEILHVPLLMRAPGILPAGVKRGGPMGLIHIMPTVLDLLGIEPPIHVSARSLADHLLEDGPAESEPIFAEANSPRVFTVDGSDPEWIPPSYSATQWPLRLVRIRTSDGFRYELYDLEADPGETRNVYDERRGEIAKLQAALDGYERNCDARRRSLSQLVALTASVPPAPAEIDQRRLEKLRALGYIE